MQSNAAAISLATQARIPTVLTTPATPSVFCSQYASSVASASQDSYYPLDAQLSVNAPATCTFDVQYGDYISKVTLVVTLPAVVNVSVGKIDGSGNPDASGFYRAIVPSTNDTCVINGTGNEWVVRELDGNDIGVDPNVTHVAALAADRNANYDWAAYFCDYTGASLLKSAELLVNGKVRQTLTGTWLFVFNELYQTQARKSAAAVGAADPNVSTALSRPKDHIRSKKVEALSGSELEIELPFFFSQSIGGGCSPFPRFQFSRSDALQLRLCFNSLRSIVVNSCGLGGEATTIVADRTSTTKIGMQTVTVPDKPGETSSVLSYLRGLVGPPSRQDFRASDFVVGVRVRELYADAATLRKQKLATYRAVLPQPHTSTASTDAAGSDVVLDTMKFVTAPVHSIYVVPCMRENTLTNRPFTTTGPTDQLTGLPRSCIHKLAVFLGSKSYVDDASKNLFTKRAAADYANNVSTHSIYQYNFSHQNPFSPTTPLQTIPAGCVVMSAISGSKVVVTPNAAAFRNHSLSGGSNYSAQRGAAVGNSIDFTCITLHMNMITITPDPKDRTEPAVSLGVDTSTHLSERQ